MDFTWLWGQGVPRLMLERKECRREGKKNHESSLQAGPAPYTALSFRTSGYSGLLAGYVNIPFKCSLSLTDEPVNNFILTKSLQKHQLKVQLLARTWAMSSFKCYFFCHLLGTWLLHVTTSHMTILNLISSPVSRVVGEHAAYWASSICEALHVG